MTNTSLYFKLARSEEKAGNDCAALLFYLFSFCDSFNSGAKDYPYGTVAKIRMLQNRLSLPDQFLMHLIHSYGPLSDAECHELLLASISGKIDSMKSILAANADMN